MEAKLSEYNFIYSEIIPTHSLASSVCDLNEKLAAQIITGIKSVLIKQKMCVCVHGTNNEIETLQNEFRFV